MVLPYLALVAPPCRDQLRHSKRTHNYPRPVGHLFSTACLWLSLLSEPNLGTNKIPFICGNTKTILQLQKMVYVAIMRSQDHQPISKKHKFNNICNVKCFLISTHEI